MGEKTDMERIGLFKELGYVSIGDPFKPTFSSSRDGILKGKGFLGDMTRLKAANNDGYFNKPFVRLFEGEGESNLVVIRRKWRNKSAELNIGKPFIIPSPAKKQSGIGSRLGCMEEIIPYFSGLLKARPKIAKENKNFITNPGKKGTGYGYANVCLNPYPQSQLDIYDNARYIYMRKDMAEHKEKSLNRKEFIPVGAYGAYFWPNPYQSDVNFGSGEDKVKPIDYYQKKTFIPSSYPKWSGGMKAGTLSPYPPSMAAEYKDPILRHLVKDIRNNTNKLYNKIPGSKSCIYQSILQRNVNFHVNNLNSHSIKTVMNY